MIRINLLPVRATRRKKAVERELVLFFIGLIVIIALSSVSILGARAQQARHAQEQVNLKADIEDLRRIVGEVDIFLERKEELEQKLDIIGRLRASKTGPVHMLDEIATRIPSKLWLDSLTEQAGRLTLTGSSINNEVIATFYGRLEDSEYFSDVFLVSIQANEVDGMTVKDFTITARVLNPNAPEAPDAAADAPTRRTR